MFWNEFKKITIASIIALLVYLLAELPLRTIINSIDSTSQLLFKVILYVAISFIFVYVYIWRNYLKDKRGENELWKEQRDLPNEYFKNDIKTIISKHKGFIICVFLICFVCWGAIGLESLILGKRAVTMILTIYAPLWMIVEVLPSFGGNIMGFLLGPIITSAFYILLLKKYRKQWYNIIILNKGGENNGK